MFNRFQEHDVREATVTAMGDDEKGASSDTAPAEGSSEQMAKFQHIATELSNARHSATVGQGTISATVDGNGALLEIEIDPDLDSSKRSRLSSLMLEAIGEARQSAATHGSDLLQSQLGDRNALADQIASAAPWLNVGARGGEARS